MNYYSIIDSVYYINNCNPEWNKYACFDLDHTLIKPKKTKFPRDAEDYIYMNNVLKNLQYLYNNKWNIVIFSNQSGKKFTEVLEKVEKIIQELLPICISIFIATDDDQYRKPQIGMFDIFIEKNDILIPHIESIFYCGDAAGRDKDFSSSDYAFAYNCSLKYQLNEDWYIPFLIPEIVFGRDISTIEEDSNNCLTYFLDLSRVQKLTGASNWIIDFVNDHYNNHEFIARSVKYPMYSSDQEIILMCGYPGSGKSTVAKYLYSTIVNYEIISNDVYKTRTNKVIQLNIQNKKSVVIDNTNIDIKTRKVYIDVAKSLNIPIYCIHVTTNIQMSRHLNEMRIATEKNNVKKVPKIVYNVHKSKYEEPTINEGFINVYKIPFMLPPVDMIHLIPTEFYYNYSIKEE